MFLEGSAFVAWLSHFEYNFVLNKDVMPAPDSHIYYYLEHYKEHSITEVTGTGLFSHFSDEQQYLRNSFPNFSCAPSWFLGH